MESPTSLKALGSKCWVSKGSKIHRRNCSTFKVCQSEELQSDQLGEQIQQLIKAGQDAGKQSTGLMNQAMQQG